MWKFLTLCAALAAVWSASARADDTCDALKRIVAAEIAADQGTLADAQDNGPILHGRILPPGMQCNLMVVSQPAYTGWSYECITGGSTKAAANTKVERMIASVAACFPQPRPAKPNMAGGMLSAMFTVDDSGSPYINVGSTAELDNRFDVHLSVTNVIKKNGEK